MNPQKQPMLFLRNNEKKLLERGSEKIYTSMQISRDFCLNLHVIVGACGSRGIFSVATERLGK